MAFRNRELHIRVEASGYVSCVPIRSAEASGLCLSVGSQSHNRIDSSSLALLVPQSLKFASQCSTICASDIYLCLYYPDAGFQDSH